MLFWVFIAAAVFVYSMFGSYVGKKNSKHWEARHLNCDRVSRDSCMCGVWTFLGYILWPIVPPCTLVYEFSGAERGDHKLRKQERELVRLKRSEEIVLEGIKIQQETLKLTEQCSRTAEEALRQQASSSLDIGSLELSP